MAVVGDKERPRAWIECLPWTSATATSEMSTNMAAWLRPPTRERRLKATIFRRIEPTPSVRMTETRESVGVFPELDGPVLENGIFTGPLDGSGRSPGRRVAEQI